MRIAQLTNGKWVIHHGGQIIDKVFDTEREADSWADEWIDDQVFDSPNTLAPPLFYMPQKGDLQ
jgi:type 1 glutamine amidotransferase